MGDHDREDDRDHDRGRGRERELAETLAAATPSPTPSTTGAGATPQAIADRYEILGLLGAGGMGTVYKVRDRQLDEVVALKTLRREWIGAPGALERFKREVKLARRVTHKNVARTFDLGEHVDRDGRTETFLTMEHVDGASLSRTLDDRGALPIDEVIRIGDAIAAALEAAHAAGVVHRDLKPDNVLLARDGRVVVTDFGIARADAGDAAMTQGSAIGTPAYMAPEQVEGGAVDARADLYALGLVLYETITGARAWCGESPLAVAAARLVRPPPDPQRADLPDALRALVRALLARRPADRPASAGDVRRALAEITTAPRARVPERAPDVARVARSLAVLPIRAAGPADDAWIADGITDDLLDGLCMIRALRVRARAPALDGEDARGFGQRLGVDLVVDGTARRAGEGVRLQLRLTSSADGYQVWAGRFEGAIGDLIVLADRAAHDVASAAGALAPSPEASSARAERAPIDPRAMELYARARRLSVRSIGQIDGLAEIEEALRLAPDEPRVLATHATILVRHAASSAGTAEAAERARKSAERAVAIAPEIPESWLALARVVLNTRDAPGAARAAHRALRLGPSLADAHEAGGRILAEADRLDEARALLERAVWLDETLVLAHLDLVRVLAFAGRWDAVQARLGAIADLSSAQHAMVRSRFALWSDEIEFPDLPPGAAPESIVAQTLSLNRACYHARSTPPELRARLLGFETARPPGSRVRTFIAQLATEVHAHVGEHELALDAIERSVEHGLEDFAWLARCPLLAPMHGDPRYLAARATVEERAQRVLRAWDEA